VWISSGGKSVPTYQYACTACGHRFEAVQAFTDATLTECPECAGRLRKVFSSVGIVFKGSGFYRTDSRSGEGKSASATSSESAKKDGSSGGSGGSGPGPSSDSPSSTSRSSSSASSSAVAAKAS
jgi:putative FmdB family regulatory protein